MSRALLRHSLLVAAIALLTFPAVGRAEPFLLGPPDSDGPVEVSLGFFLSDLSAIDEQRETFEFEARVTLQWRDERQGFDPDELGVAERVYQGNYQFAEVFDGWWPQLILANESGGLEWQSVLLRIRPDGRMTLVSEVHASAKTPMQLRRYPFDRQSLEARFEVLGFDAGRVVLVPDPETSGGVEEGTDIAQWGLRDLQVASRRHRPAYLVGGTHGISQIVVALEAERRPAHMLKIVIAPLTLLVMLTFAVFWMDRESLGDRMDISFIGILTVVAYQIVLSDSMPAIAYLTLATAFLYSIYLVLAASVVVNVVVSKLDQGGQHALGNRVDRACRWIMPLGFVTANALSVVYFFSVY